MAINLKTTQGLSAQGVNILGYGLAGSGKTSLIKTLPNPVVLSAEGGLLSISDTATPFVEVTDMSTLLEALEWAKGSEEAKQFDSFALDSISEIAEVVLAHEKTEAKDPRQAYGALQDAMAYIVRAFRDLPKHVYFTAKCEKTADETGRLLYAPAMPGNKLAQSLPYFFDEVLAMRVERDEDGTTQRALLTSSDGLWQAKDRSGRLDDWEPADLGEIIKKIGGEF